MMKQTLLILMLLLISYTLAAPPSGGLVIRFIEPFRPYEKVWNATCKVETNNDPYAVGDRHLKNKSYGIAQVRQTRLDDFYRRTGIRYTVWDMFDPMKAKRVFMFYARGDNEVVAREWNGGPRGMQKKSTIKYWKKIQKHL